MKDLGLTRFLKLLDKLPGNYIQQISPITIFAPTNRAFEGEYTHNYHEYVAI